MNHGYQSSGKPKIDKNKTEKKEDLPEVKSGGGDVVVMRFGEVSAEERVYVPVMRFVKFWILLERTHENEREHPSTHKPPLITIGRSLTKGAFNEPSPFTAALPAAASSFHTINEHVSLTVMDSIAQQPQNNVKVNSRFAKEVFKR
ncbi:hypothetical protein LR48_Vigan06g087400 [Vigna angularis]|uniref:Uncharacterized protein n=1 Tax=Phaseolus angularis TaxID=3914 RepID=A0A0L9US47_PHAAN|nr:hypothetical protein LR48_Vigan06g087400 [Vigna angularis]